MKTKSIGTLGKFDVRVPETLKDNESQKEYDEQFKKIDWKDIVKKHKNKAVLLCAEDSEEIFKVFKDNVHAKCELCGRKITHRPFVPKEVKKICNFCFIPLSSTKLN